MPPAENHGSERFIAELAAAGIAARADGPAVVFAVAPIAGELAGVDVDTAVSINELQAWPATVPHWLHFPDPITFPHTNIDTNDCLPGWRRHSRDIGSLDAAVPIIVTFLAHIRGTLSTARKAT